MAQYPPKQRLYAAATTACVAQPCHHIPIFQTCIVIRKQFAIHSLLRSANSPAKLFILWQTICFGLSLLEKSVYRIQIFARSLSSDAFIDTLVIIYRICVSIISSFAQVASNKLAHKLHK